MKQGIKLLIITVGLLSYCFSVFGQEKYFYQQYGWNYIHNGSDIVAINGEIIVCGDTQNQSTWNGYYLTLDETGNILSSHDYLSIETQSAFDYIFIDEENQKHYLGVTGYEDSTNVYSSCFKTKFNNLNEPENIEILFNNGIIDDVASNSAKDKMLIGGYVFYPEIPTGQKPYLAMIDDEGNIIWELELDYESNSGINGIVWDEESGYIFCSGSLGVSTISEGDGTPFFLKLSLDGELLIEKFHDGPLLEFGGDLIKNGDYFVASSNYFTPIGYKYARLVKYNQNGNEIWKTEVFESNYTSFNDVTKGWDGHYYVSGFINTDTPEGMQALIAKFNSNGELLWIRTFGGEGNDYAYAHTLDEDGAILITGRTESNTNGADALVIKTNCMGLMTEPEANFTHQINNNEVLFENLSQFVYIDSIDGGHYLWDFGDGNTSNEINPIHSYTEASTYEVTLTAVVCQDTAIYQECLYLDENALCCGDIEEIPIAAFSNEISEDSLSIGFSNESQNIYEEFTNGASFLWQFGDGNNSTEFNPTHSYSEAGLYEVSLSVFFCNDSTSFTHNLLIGDTTDTALNSIETTNNVSVFPNPSSGLFTFSFEALNKKAHLRLYNALGETVHLIELTPSMTEIKIDLSSFAKGVYFWQLGEEIGKVVLE